MLKQKPGLLSNLGSDLPAGLVVFLVALPLCLGIALASQGSEVQPSLFSGVIAGITGGIIVGMASGSHLSVSGPAAGLTAIVAGALDVLGSFQAFTLAVVIAGMLQVVLGFAKAGVIGHYFPSAVIKGMLAGIGLTLILKQIPHALGDDQNYEGEEAFWQPDGENSFTEIIVAVQNISFGALIISVLSLLVLIAYQKDFLKRSLISRILPGPLLVVLLGIAINSLVYTNLEDQQLYLADDHLVSLSKVSSLQEFGALFTFPDFSRITDWRVLEAAVTIALIASLETLLSLDAVDKLDPYKRIAPPNRELKAQGLGNIVSGLVGGLPVTSVIVRSSANVDAGAKTKMSAIIHGILLLVSVIFFSNFLNLIPKASLAAILLLVGYNLVRPALLKDMWKQGITQFVPFIVTIVAIMVTDLLKGIFIGIIVGVIFVIRTNTRQAIHMHHRGNNYRLDFRKDASFLNKALIRNKLHQIPENSSLQIDLTKADFIDHDIIETIQDFKYTANLKNIKMKFVGAGELLVKTELEDTE